MALDFKDVIRLLEVLVKLPIKEVISIFDKNEKAGEDILKDVPDPEAPEDPTPPRPDLGNDVVYHSLVAKPYWCQKANGQLYSNDEFKKIVAGGGAQMQGDRFCVDLTPKDEFGREIGTGDSRHVLVPGDVPVRYLWWRDGKLNTKGDPRGNEQQEEDHFELQSVRDRDNGFTPVLQLETAEPGGHVVEFQAYILAEHNGGKDVYSNKIRWNCD